MLTPMPPASAMAAQLRNALVGTTELWELRLLESLFMPMTPYPLPGVRGRGFAEAQIAFKTADYDGITPWYDQPTHATFGMVGQQTPSANPEQCTSFLAAKVGGEVLRMPSHIGDAYINTKYDQREGLVRGTFSVVESGSFLLYFNPLDQQNPVRLVSVKDTQKTWMASDNNGFYGVSPIFAGGVANDTFAWDRDPYRGYVDSYIESPIGQMLVGRTQIIYVGGASLHMAVQAKTAYSDVAIKARNLIDYDRRFFDLPDESGEYGDPTQPHKANEGIAIYNGSTWNNVIQVDPASPAPAKAVTLQFAVQFGYPLLEVHVVNATTGGAPVNFNFEARCWLGVAQTTLRENATNSFHTIPCDIPGWFTSARTRGAISKEASKLASELIENTQRAIVMSHPPLTVRKLASAVQPAAASGGGGLGGFMKSVLGQVGIDTSNPLESIAKLVLPKALKAVGTLIGV